MAKKTQPKRNLYMDDIEEDFAPTNNTETLNVFSEMQKVKPPSANKQTTTKKTTKSNQPLSKKNQTLDKKPIKNVSKETIYKNITIKSGNKKMRSFSFNSTDYLKLKTYAEKLDTSLHKLVIMWIQNELTKYNNTNLENFSIIKSHSKTVKYETTTSLTLRLYEEDSLLLTKIANINKIPVSKVLQTIIYKNFNIK